MTYWVSGRRKGSGRPEAEPVPGVIVNRGDDETVRRPSPAWDVGGLALLIGQQAEVVGEQHCLFTR